MSLNDASNNHFHSKSSLSSYEITRKRILKHHLTPQQKTLHFIKEYIATAIFTLVIMMMIIPALVLPLSVLLIFAYGVSLTLKKQLNWVLCAPFYLKKKKDQNDKLGLLYLGNDQNTEGKALWFNRYQLTTHMLLFGMTGSGKTEMILGMMYQYMLLGSGAIFVDGKASINTWAKLYSTARQLGLEDNLLVLNFGTGGLTTNNTQEKISNTFNPFVYGSSDNLMEMLSGMMGQTGGESAMWRGRAEALGRCLLRALCELRDLGKIELSINAIREYMALEKLEALSRNNAISDFAKSSIEHYLNDLPGWKFSKKTVDDDKAADAGLEASKQHNFLTMQFTNTLELLAGTYAHITKTNISEIDFMDVIVNRRILYIMLPSLEKSPETLKNLGRMVVTALRNALSQLLGGEKLTGSKELLLDTRAFNAEIPFGIFLDEYGSYCVEGFADIAAQARELNIMMCFSGQDYASFKQGSENEAKRIVSNTGIKVFMKIECPETKNLAAERASKAYHYLATQIDKSENNGKYKDSGQGALQQIDRIIFDDLFKQAPGECHIIYGNNLWRAKSFYGDFKILPHFRINSFIKLQKPKLNEKGAI